MEFHEKLARLILAHPGSQNDQAVDLGIDKSHYSRLARGAAQPTRAQLVRIARYYGADLEWLADDDMDEPPVPEPVIDPAVLRLLRLMSTDAALRRLGQVEKDDAPVGPGPSRELPYVVQPNAPAPASRPHPRKSSG